MGIIWKSAMPLLTTLAALVIIVNSAEEDMETEYRHDLRPRMLDTGTPSHDQTWRAMEADPPIQQPRHTDNWDNESPDELPKRRRAGRKRKRRPQTPTDDNAPQDRYIYPDEPPRPYFDVEFDNTRQTTEMPKRRQKKPETRPIRWTDDVVDLERPLRRRGQRRKRPSLETWPALSEFRHSAAIVQDNVETKTNEEPTDPVTIDDILQENPQDVPVYRDEHNFMDQQTSNLKVDLNQPANNAEFGLPLAGEEHVEPTVQDVEDKSLSEFSSEFLMGAPRPTKQGKLNIEQNPNKNTSILTEFDKTQDKCILNYCSKQGLGNLLSFILQHDNVDIDTKYVPVLETPEQEKANYKVKEIIDAGKVLEDHKKRSKLIISKCKDKIQRPGQTTLLEVPPVTWMESLKLVPNKRHTRMPFLKDTYLMDPLTLKDILKRSNGTSLSEILQQHNLSLTDLLRGKQHAVSIFKSHESLEVPNRNPSEPMNDLKEDLTDKDESEEQTLVNSETKYATEPATESPVPEEVQTEANKKDEDELTTAKTSQDKTPKIYRRRYPTGMRKKLRMRPMLNNTYKGQLSRDIISMTARKYSQHRRNVTKSKEWKEVVPSMMQNKTQVENNWTNDYETTTVFISPEETTITIDVGNNNSSSEENRPDDDLIIKLDDVSMEMTETTIIPIKETTTEVVKTEKPTMLSIARPTPNASGLRRQAFNNRLKRKRLKHKNATTEPPQDDIIKQLFGMGSLVSSSEFIARTQEPKTTVDENNDDLTTLDDFMTTESSRRTEGVPAQTRTFTVKVSTTSTPTPTSTEETAKFEIEEILNDTQTSAKLSKILMERNMTLSELVEHRERGSSHVHLADIFHNASREPNPPEPFLSKSLLEPISKETYPLRALLDANSHDPNLRATTVDTSMISNVNIPVVMDFRNNVNENAENMGIMSLFNNFTKHINKSKHIDSKPEISATTTPVDAVNVTNYNENETARESRILSESQDDVVSWNEIFSLMGRNQNNETELNNLEELSAIKPFKKFRLDEDSDGDGLIVLEDLQHLKDLHSNIASSSDEKIQVNAFENKESPHGSGILDKIPSQTKSVTVATASIAGLAMILFLLTYAAFKWKQQRSVIRKKRSFADERIPTPVFENRKGHKNNSSTRSISPMLQTSNIYTLNTLDSQNGKDSPDYMWDTLRKPFQ